MYPIVTMQIGKFSIPVIELKSLLCDPNCIEHVLGIRSQSKWFVDVSCYIWYGNYKCYWCYRVLLLLWYFAHVVKKNSYLRNVSSILDHLNLINFQSSFLQCILCGCFKCNWAYDAMVWKKVTWLTIVWSARNRRAL